MSTHDDEASQSADTPADDLVISLISDADFDGSGDLQQAVETLRQALRTAPDDHSFVTATIQLATMLAENLKDPHGAITVLLQGTERIPSERQFWQRLAALHLSQNNPAEAASAFKRETQLVGDGRERRSLLVEYAKLTGLTLQQTADAVLALQEVLTQDPADANAVAALTQIFRADDAGPQRHEMVRLLRASWRATENWPALVQLLEDYVESLENPTERVAVWREVADVKATKINDPDGAFAALSGAFDDAPDDPALRFELEKVTEATNRWEVLAHTYASSLAKLGDTQEGRNVRRRLAEILDQRLNRSAEAVEHYQALFGSALPDDLPSLESMERLLRSEHKAQELLEVMAAILARLPQEQLERRRALLAEAAQLSIELRDKARAVDFLTRQVEIDPQNVDAMHRLCHHLMELGQGAQTLRYLDQLVEMGSQNPQLVDDLLRRAEIQLHLGNTEETLKNYRQVLQRKRDHQQAVEGLERLMDVVENKLDVVQTLEPVYTARQDHGKLAWVLEKKLDATHDANARKQLMRRVGDIFENRLQQKDRAFVMARRSLSEDPADMGVRMWIEKLAGETGSMRELADIYTEEANRAAAPLNLQFFRRAAALYHEKLKDMPMAVRQYQAILRAEPRDEKALAGLEAIYRENQDVGELVMLLRRRLAQTAGLERKREYLNEIATLQAEKLTDLRSAVGALKELLTVSPDDLAAFDRAEGWLTHMGAWEDLLEMYQNETARLSDRRGRDVVSRRTDLEFRRARILDQQLGEDATAAPIFAKILKEDRTHKAALDYLSERARAAVPFAMDLLERAAADNGDWPKYVEMLDLRLTHTPENELRREIYLKLATAQDLQLKQGEMAFLVMARAFSENKADAEVLTRMEAIASKYGLWEELVGVLSDDLDALPDPKMRTHLLHRLGEVCGTHLGNMDEAIGYLKRALQYDPSDEVALASLDSLLEKNQRWALLADTIERRIEVALEPRRKSELLERLAVVWGDKLMDTDAALRCHQQILDIDPDHPITLRSMQKLYAEVEDWDNLARNLERQAKVLADKDDQLRIHKAAGALYAEEMSDNKLAIVHWLQVLELAPADEEANAALQVLLTAEERWEDLAELYRKQLAYTQAPAEKLDINHRLGVILGQKLGRRDDALQSWLKVLEQDGKNVDALTALMPLYSERAMWQEFSAVARRLVPLVAPGQAKEVRIALARALGENLGLRDDAIRIAREVRALEPHTVDQLDQLASILSNIQCWDEAVITLEKAAAREEDTHGKVTRYFLAANIYCDELKKPNDAQECYQNIIIAQPDNLQAYQALAEILRNTQQWRKLVAVDEEFFPRAPQSLRVPILEEVRETQYSKLGEKDLAFIAACRVFSENPDDLAAYDVLERIGLESGATEEIAAVLDDEIERISRVDIKIAGLRKLAALNETHIKNVPAAEEALQRILTLDATDIAAMDALALLASKEDRFDKQIAALERKLASFAEESDKKQILAEIAHVWEVRLTDADEAINTWHRILQIDGADARALDELTRIYQSNGRWTDLAHTLTRKVELESDGGQNVSLRLRVAGLCENELRDTEAAIQWYQGVLEFEPNNTQALSSLERLYTGAERWGELVSVFERGLTLTESSEEKLRLLAKIASIYETEFTSLVDAVACYQRAFEVDPKHITTIKGLERLLRATRDWPRLIEVMEHHVGLVEENDVKADLYLEMGDIFYRELARVDKAEHAYNAVRQINASHVAALNALGKLYERSGNWFQALEVLQKESEVLYPEPTALPVLARIGKINEDMLSDRQAAKAAYERALTIDSGFAPALGALKEIARSSEDWEAYSGYLVTQAETCQDSELKTDLFCEAARYYQEVREDEPNAIRFYQRALGIIPEQPEASRALGDIYFRNELWEESRGLYLVVVKFLDKTTDPKEFSQKYYRLGYTSEKLEQRDIALGYYRQAFEADATYLPALEGLGQALLSAQRWDEAQKVFQTVLIHHRDALTESEVVDIQWQLGDIYLKQEQPDRAYKQFEKALEVDPDHAASLHTLYQIDLQKGDWELAYQRMARYADVAPGPQRVGVLAHMSRLAREQLGDLRRVIDPLERARRLGTAPREILVDLARAYVEANSIPKAVEVFEQAVAMDGDATKKAELCFELGQIYEIQMQNIPLAIQKYNDALDADPKQFNAFERVESMLATRQEWALLEANYRAMITRAKELSPQVRSVLWRSLGELYRHALRNVDNAIMAYEVVHKLNPGHAQDITILAELYSNKPESRSKAIRMQHDLLTGSASPVPCIRALRRLYHASRDFDAVYVLCNALTFLKEADEDERKMVEYLARGVPSRASRGVSEDLWREVMLPEVYEPIGALCATLYRTIPDFVTEPAKDLGLKKRDQLDVRQSELYFANMVRYVAGALTIPPVDVFRKASSMEPLRLVNAQPPALVAGESNDVFRDAAQKVVLFHIGRNMAFSRPELFLGGVLPVSELRDLLFGLCLVYNRTLAHIGDMREVTRWCNKFEKMPPAALKRLQAPAQAAYPMLNRGAALGAYVQAAEAVAERAGLIVCTDLGAAARGVTEAGDGASGVPVRDRIRQLVLFGVSPAYLQIRKLMGAALVENKAAG